MSFTDHKITQFVHRVVDLPDQPNLPADELKARFDSSPEELRQAHNALCDDADRLDDRVSGIIAETFGDTITKSMLSDELADEIDAKATKAELDEDTAALDARLDTVETALPQKVECYFGTYEGDGQRTKTITLGFSPRAVIVASSRWAYSGMAFQNIPMKYSSQTVLETTDTGFIAYYINNYSYMNLNSTDYFYIAFK